MQATTAIIQKIASLLGRSIAELGAWGRIPAPEHVIRYHNALTYAQQDGKITALNLRGAGIDGEKLEQLFAIDGLASLEALNLSENTYTQITFPATWNNLRQVVISPHETLEQVAFAGDVSKLTHVLLENCPALQTPPPEIVAGGNKALGLYFNQLAAERKVDLKPHINKTVKLILAGNSHAGKTSLRDYLRNPAAACPDKPSTHWLEIEEIPFQSSTLRVFDFGGQEYYHDTHHLFFTHQTAYVLVWDEKSNVLATCETEQIPHGGGKPEKVELQHYPLEYWLDSIRFHVSPYEKHAHDIAQSEGVDEAFETGKLNRKTAQTAVLVLQNKIDEGGVRYLDAPQYQAQYPFIQDFAAISLKNKKRLTHFDDVFQDLLEHVGITGSEWPGTYGMIVEAVKAHTQTYKMSLPGFVEFCNAAMRKHPSLEQSQDLKGVLLDNAGAQVVAGFLSRLGYLMYYPHVEALKDTVFFHTVTEKIYSLLENVPDGVLTEAHIRETLQQNSWSSVCTDLLNLMKHFKIVFEHPFLEHHYVAPLFLPKEPIQGVKLLLRQIPEPRRRLQYTGFIHKKVILDFYQQYGPHVLLEPTDDSASKDDDLLYLWRNGIIVQRKNHPETVLVRFEMGQGTREAPAYVTVTPLSPPAQKGTSGTLETEIWQELNKINQGWHTNEMVSANGKDFIPLSKVTEAIKLRKMECVYEGKSWAVQGFRDFLSEEQRRNMPQKKLFISYASKDTAFMKRLVTHLKPLRRSGVIEVWFDRLMEAGDEWNEKIQQELEASDMVMFLVSPDFLASDYIMDVEVPAAVQKHQDKQVDIFPVLLKPCHWENHPDLSDRMISLQPLEHAEEKQPVLIGEPGHDMAWQEIIKQLEKVLKSR